MSFYCKRYREYKSNAQVFAYCMKRNPNGGKCSDLHETKKGGKKRANATVHRDDDGNHILLRKARLLLARDD